MSKKAQVQTTNGGWCLPNQKQGENSKPEQPKQNLALINGYVEHAAEAPVSEPGKMSILYFDI